MNIGIVTTWFERGAAYVSRMYRDTLKLEHNVFIYARGGEAHAKANPVWDTPDVTWGRKPLIPYVRSVDLRDFERWIKKNKIELVFFNEQSWWEPVIFANKLGVKTGAYVDYYTEETMPLFAAYDLLICNTKRHYSAFSWHKNAHFVSWGVETGLFLPKNLGPVDEKMITFFHSCGYSPNRKGTDILLKAFTKVKGGSKLIIHSQVDIAKYFPEMQNLISNLKKEKKLTIYHETVTAPGLYHLGDVYVYPSRLDGIGLTIAEALSCGLPVIVSDNPPMNEFIDGTNGRTVAIERLYSRSDGYYWPQCMVDLDELANRMQWYVDSFSEIASLKHAAREHAELNLNWMKNSKVMPKIFSDVQKQSTMEQEKAALLVRSFELQTSPLLLALTAARKTLLTKGFAALINKIESKYSS